MLDLKGKTTLAGNVLQKYGSAKELLVVSSVVVGGVLWLRYGVLEAGVLPGDCAATFADGLQGLCLAKWLLVQTFMQQRLGWLSLALGLAAFVLRRSPLAWGGWISGLAGLVLYSFDYAAVGALLSLLVLARAGAQGRRGEQQTGDEPANGLRVGRLG